jgi:hypothetical protein
MRFIMSRSIFPLRFFGLLVLLLGAYGCGSSDKTQLTGASASGVVRYQGKPVTGGIIQLWDKDGNESAEGGINGDGTYKVLNAPLGVCRVVVNTEAVKHDRRALLKRYADKGAPALPEESGPPKVYMAVNPKYTDVKKTDVQITIQRGSQTQDIDLP